MSSDRTTYTDSRARTATPDWVSWLVRWRDLPWIARRGADLWAMSIGPGGSGCERHWFTLGAVGYGLVAAYCVVFGLFRLACALIVLAVMWWMVRDRVGSVR